MFCMRLIGIFIDIPTIYKLYMYTNNYKVSI